MKINGTGFNPDWVASFKSDSDFAENCNLDHLNLTEQNLKDVYNRICGPGTESKPTGSGKTVGKKQGGRDIEPSSGAIIEGANE
jgi:hypothetical protein